MTKGFKGAFKDTPLDMLVYSVLKEMLARSKIDPSLIEDVCLGNVRCPLRVIGKSVLVLTCLSSARPVTEKLPTSPVLLPLLQESPTLLALLPSAGFALRV